MTDDEFVLELQEILDADPPTGRRGRQDDEGRECRITATRIVASDDGFDDLELTVEIDSATVVSRLLFDRTWREESGLTDPRDYAAFVEARWPAGVVEPDDDGDGDGDGDGRRDGPGQDELWHLLERSLRVDAAGLNRVGHGAWEIVESDGDPVTVHVTPQQWRAFAAGREQQALDELDDVIGSRWDDEDHIVFFRRAFHHSVRAELPPLRSRLSPQ